MIFLRRHGCCRTRFNRLATRRAKRVDERRLARVGEAYDEQTTLRSVCGEERVFFSGRRVRSVAVGTMIMMMMMDKSNRHGKASGALFSSGTEDRAREGRRRRGRGDRVPAPASTRTFFFARPSATSRLFHSPMRAWGGTERGRVRAARASLGTSAFGRGATRERATSISARPKRCRPRARAEKRRLSSRSHSVRADASGVSASRLAEMGGDHRGGKRHRHGVRGL